MFDLSNSVIHLVQSYISGRSQYVRVGRTVVVSNVLCEYGVPQGSVLGPLSYTLCVAPVTSAIIASFDVNHIQYADDTQLYISRKHQHFYQFRQLFRSS